MEGNEEAVVLLVGEGEEVDVASQYSPVSGRFEGTRPRQTDQTDRQDRQWEAGRFKIDRRTAKQSASTPSSRHKHRQCRAMEQIGCMSRRCLLHDQRDSIGKQPSRCWKPRVTRLPCFSPRCSRLVPPSALCFKHRQMLRRDAMSQPAHLTFPFSLVCILVLHPARKRVGPRTASSESTSPFFSPTCRLGPLYCPVSLSSPAFLPASRNAIWSFVACPRSIASVLWHLSPDCIWKSGSENANSKKKGKEKKNKRRDRLCHPPWHSWSGRSINQQGTIPRSPSHQAPGQRHRHSSRPASHSRDPGGAH